MSLIVAAILIVIPLARPLSQVPVVTDEAWQARADHAAVAVFAEHLPDNAVVITHTPFQWAMHGVAAAQVVRAWSEPELVEALSASGPVFYHQNYWDVMPPAHGAVEEAVTMSRLFRERYVMDTFRIVEARAGITYAVLELGRRRPADISAPGGVPSETSPVVVPAGFSSTGDLLRVESAALHLGATTERAEILVEWRGESAVNARVIFVGPEELEILAPPRDGATITLRPGFQTVPLVLGRGRLDGAFSTRAWLVVDIEEGDSVGAASASASSMSAGSAGAVDLVLLGYEAPSSRPRFSLLAGLVLGLVLASALTLRACRMRRRSRM